MLNSSFHQAMLPRFKEIHPADIEPMIRLMLSEHRAKVVSLLKEDKSYTWDNLMQPLEELHEALSEQWSPIAHLYAVMESDALREVYHHVLPLITDYYTELSQNERLYAAILSIANQADFAALHPAQKKIIENDLRDFKLAGVHLPPQKKARMGELQKQLTQLMTTFSDHVLDATQSFYLQANADEIIGLPPQAKTLAMEQAKKRELTGYVFTLDYPSYSTAVKYLQNRTLRQKLYEAYVTRASDCGPNAGKWDNTTVMEDIIKIRHEIALLVGFDNYAGYSLATKMAKLPDKVLDFLSDLLVKSKPMALKEYEELKTFATVQDGLTILEPWDVPYYSERLQKKLFDFTQEELRPYFPIETVMTGMFTIVNKLYGLTIKEQKDVEVWHQDVQFFAIYDEKNILRGGFYTDLYARDHKRDGAWMDECRTRRQLSSGQIQCPVAYLTCNFMRAVGGEPALLTHDDVLTLFHEFGHCLHHLLTKVDYPSVAGINGVAWDAVEFPSQFMENFCWEREALDLIAKHYQTGAPLPEALYQKMISAKNFQAGLQTMRQLEFALFDFRLHLEYDQEKKRQVQAVLDQVRAQTAVLPVFPSNRFQHSFSHVFAGSYAAGYYSYKWAEVLSADAYAKFEEEGIFNHATGTAFMEAILEVGGVRDPMASFVAFRGREPHIDALLKHSGIVSESISG